MSEAAEGALVQSKTVYHKKFQLDKLKQPAEWCCDDGSRKRRMDAEICLRI